MDACYKNGYVVWFDWEHWESEALALETDTARLRNADRSTLICVSHAASEGIIKAGMPSRSLAALRAKELSALACQAVASQRCERRNYQRWHAKP